MKQVNILCYSLISEVKKSSQQSQTIFELVEDNNVHITTRIPQRQNN